MEAGRGGGEERLDAAPGGLSGTARMGRVKGGGPSGPASSAHRRVGVEPRRGALGLVTGQA